MNAPQFQGSHMTAASSIGVSPETAHWIELKPSVNAEAEFLEIASDFGNPLEIIREAISNSFDASATNIRISFEVEEVDGASSLVIEIEDNGAGMDEQVISRDFWGLGFSRSRGDKDKIGEKGHGTKIYLRSELVQVKTCSETGSYEAVCERPMRALTRREIHSPKWRQIDKYQDHTGTLIRVTGYNQNERASFIQDTVKDYILWFTKFGSVELMFGNTERRDVQLQLKCLDRDDYEEVPFGHYFPPESDKISKLFEEYGADAADHFVKRYSSEQRLPDSPEVTFQTFISVEGDGVKRSYNPLIRDRSRKGSGKYKVADRYGIWLCKDYIPVQRINDWLIGFGTGSNSLTLLHGFVNCQKLKLTANRGSVANTEPKIVEELCRAVQSIADKINHDLNKDGIYTLFQWQSEDRTLAQEKADFEMRSKSLVSRPVATLDGRTLLEPQNESELYGLFMTVYSLRPEIFDFEPLDYNTSRGIDLIARNKTDNKISESALWYVELKYYLKGSLNHGFKYLRWIVCWDFDKSVKAGSEFAALQETDSRILETGKTEDGRNVYFLSSKTVALKIQVLRLREFLTQRLSLEFKPSN